jgi:hypothetical protein
MFSLLQRGLGEEDVRVVVMSCLRVVLGVATVALFWRIVVRPHEVSAFCSPVQYLLLVLMIDSLNRTFDVSLSLSTRVRRTSRLA